MFTSESPRNALGSKTARLEFMVQALESELEAPSDLSCPNRYPTKREGAGARCSKEKSGQAGVTGLPARQSKLGKHTRRGIRPQGKVDA